MRAALLIALTLSVSPAFAATEKQIRRDCTADALRYCATVIPKGRTAIIACMVENKDKLQAKCSQHMW